MNLRSLLDAETIGLAEEFYTVIISNEHDLRQIPKQRLNIKIQNDTGTLLKVIIRNNSKSKRRLMIGIKAAIEAYNDGTINDVISIRCE